MWDDDRSPLRRRPGSTSRSVMSRNSSAGSMARYVHISANFNLEILIIFFFFFSLRSVLRVLCSVLCCAQCATRTARRCCDSGMYRHSVVLHGFRPICCTFNPFFLSFLFAFLLQPSRSFFWKKSFGADTSDTSTLLGASVLQLDEFEGGGVNFILQQASIYLAEGENNVGIP